MTVARSLFSRKRGLADDIKNKERERNGSRARDDDDDDDIGREKLDK